MMNPKLMEDGPFTEPTRRWKALGFGRQKLCKPGNPNLFFYCYVKGALALVPFCRFTEVWGIKDGGLSKHLTNAHSRDVPDAEWLMREMISDGEFEAGGITFNPKPLPEAFNL